MDRMCPKSMKDSSSDMSKNEHVQQAANWNQTDEGGGEENACIFTVHQHIREHLFGVAAS